MKGKYGFRKKGRDNFINHRHYWSNLELNRHRYLDDKRKLKSPREIGVDQELLHILIRQIK